VKPLFQTELEIDRESVSQATVNSILEDPEAETYQFVVKAVQDNGTRTLATLAEWVSELKDQALDEVVRTALLRKEMRDRELQLEQERGSAQEELRNLKRELDGTSRALQVAILELSEARRESAESRQQVEAILNTKAFRLLAPLRRLYGRLRRRPKPQQVSPEAM
jgi:DNA repair exonuclease SbcCD ATPase subunit